jgi:hypothetical protein
MNDFITQQFSSYNLFQAAGDVVELNAWVHDDIIDQIKQHHLPLELKMMSRVSPVNEYHRTYNE